MRKADVTYHSDGYRRSRPAVNVKVYARPTDAMAIRVLRDEGQSLSCGFSLAWIEEHLTEREQMHFWDLALEDAWEQLREDVNAESVFGRHVDIYSEGRSSGWAVVEGIESADDWDAIRLGRWAKFVRYCRETVHGIPYQYLGLIYLNVFEPQYDKAKERSLRQTLRDAGGL